MVTFFLFSPPYTRFPTVMSSWRVEGWLASAGGEGAQEGGWGSLGNALGGAAALLGAVLGVGLAVLATQHLWARRSAHRERSACQEEETSPTAPPLEDVQWLEEYV